MFDTIACAAPVGLGLVRLANFINSELWGRVTDVPWAVIFPNGGPQARHPSQIYEALLEGLVLFLAMRLLSHSRFKLQTPGFISGAFVDRLRTLPHIRGVFPRTRFPIGLPCRQLADHGHDPVSADGTDRHLGDATGEMTPLAQ